MDAINISTIRSLIYCAYTFHQFTAFHCNCVVGKKKRSYARTVHHKIRIRASKLRDNRQISFAATERKSTPKPTSSEKMEKRNRVYFKMPIKEPSGRAVIAGGERESTSHTSYTSRSRSMPAFKPRPLKVRSCPKLACFLDISLD